jgi:hypothetical protein
MADIKNLEQPEGLSGAGKKAYRAIIKQLEKNGLTDSGGCKTFYSPQEWSARGEEYGKGAALIVVYDGGDIRYFFNSDTALEYGWSLIDGMQKALDAKDLWAEACTGWYSAIYAD